MSMSNTGACRWVSSFLAGAFLSTAACSDGLEIAGTWRTNFGSIETIADDRWQSITHASETGPELRSSWTIAAFENDGRWMIRQSDPDGFDPNTFDRTEWVASPEDDSLFVCTSTFGHATADGARTSTQTADATNPAQSGCGPFSWTRLTPVRDR